jgi:RNA polymerase sigma factor (sigma-70 family)
VLTKQLQDVVERKFISFLLKSVHGIVYDYRRRHARIREQEVLIDVACSGYDFDNVGCDIHECDVDWLALDNPRLSSALRRLSERQSVIIHMYVFEGYTELEIATQLNITQQSVNTTKRRALANLSRDIGGVE